MITTLFVDVGGVLLTNGWDSHAREQATDLFSLNQKEFDSRHALFFPTYELGKISLEDYLNFVVFYEPRSFSKESFIQFMYQQSQKLPGMIELVKEFKQKYHLKVGTVSNEGLELSRYRFKTFHLEEFIDFFISSSFIQLRKPDPTIYQVALDIAQALPEEVIYIDDRQALAEVATAKFGIFSITHRTVEETRAILEQKLRE